VRVRGPTRARGRVLLDRGPGPIERALRGLASAAFWRCVLAKLAALAVLVAALFLLYEIATSSYFYASEVTVEGASLLGTQEILDAAAVSGVHILWVNSRQTAQRIGLLPTVKEASVHAIFPRRVAIAVTERQPRVHWQLGNVNFLVDAEAGSSGPRRAVKI